MPFNINQFKSQLTSGGARPNLFEVQIPLPIDLKVSSEISSSYPREFTFMCKAASIPASSVSEIEIPFKGRKLYSSGNRTYEPWSVTVINDENFLIRSAFEKWLEAINGPITNEKNSGLLSRPNSYQVDGVVKQFSQRGDIIRIYKFSNLFPTDISSIELSWDETDTIEEFQVTFRYDYWKISEANE